MIFRSRNPRSHTPSPQQVHYDADKREHERIQGQYELSIAQWSVEQGCEHHDYTPDQLDRYEALRIAQGDARVGRCLIFGQLLFDTERICEYPRPESVAS